MQDNYNPLCAIVVYGNKSNYEASYYLERREFNSNSKAFGPATPLSQEDYNDIALSVKEKQTSKGIKTRSIIDNMLSFKHGIGEKTIIWKVKADKYKLFFGKKLGIKSGEYYIPNLIFCLSNNSLKVYATKTYNIKETTKLYKAPFHNISSDGSICMGNAKGDSNLEYVEDIIDSWNQAFFNSTFTHFNDSKLTKKNLVDTLKESVKTKKFDTTCLKESNQKLKQLL